MRRGVQVVAAAAVLALAGGLARAMFMDGTEAPVSRLLANVEKALVDSPDDPHLLYLKGRTHAVAYAAGVDATAHVAWDTPPLPGYTTRDHDRLKFKGDVDDTRLKHLTEGIAALRRAAELAKAPASGSRNEDDRPMLQLGLAWLLDDGSRFAPKVGRPDGSEVKEGLPEAEIAELNARIARLGAMDGDKPDVTAREKAFAELRGSFARCANRLVAHRDAKDELVRAKVGELLTLWWRDQALAAYRIAYRLARPGDVADDLHLDGTYRITVEAGDAILRLLPDLPANAVERKEVADTLEQLDRQGFAVTPIIFPTTRAQSLAALVPGDRTARFDLAGDGVVRTWAWPTADAGFLVWAPDPTKAITSGRQMFGSRTWWIFWRDGYEPLSMLDDDRSGRLSGAELDGIGVWRDRNRNAVCDPGEVEPVCMYGVEWIAVIANTREGGAPANTAGIGMRDGTTRPTYDWTPTSIPEPDLRLSASRE